MCVQNHSVQAYCHLNLIVHLLFLCVQNVVTFSIHYNYSLWLDFDMSSFVCQSFTTMSIETKTCRQNAEAVQNLDMFSNLKSVKVS